MRRSNRESFHGKILDCFAALAMTEFERLTSFYRLALHLRTHLRVLAACFARALPSVSPSSKARAQGRPGAGWHPKSRVRMKTRTGWTTGAAGRPAFPARMVLTVSFVLSPGSDALLPPSPCGWLTRAPGRAATSPQALTHRPRASGPHDFSVRAHPHPHSRRLACAHRRGRTRTLSAPCRIASAAAHGFPRPAANFARRRRRGHRIPARVS